MVRISDIKSVSEFPAIAPEFVEELLRDVRLSEAQFKAGKGVLHRDAKAQIRSRIKR